MHALLTAHNAAAAKKPSTLPAEILELRVIVIRVCGYSAVIMKKIHALSERVDDLRYF